ncbi:MAG: DUF2333 family protein [Endozoicomonas sp. (ex Botrylloides leachii)]|nr:DUF2333 family protein [Endozoicomonas sp. (ex Botrylloides leachii)]
MALDGVREWMKTGVQVVTGKTKSKVLIALVVLVLLLMIGLSIYWSIEPNEFSVRANAEQMARARGQTVVPGYTTTATLYRVADTLLTKPGGFLHNDIMPPSVFMDNMPNWELGVLTQVRDMARAMRRDFSRSQSQSKEDPNLAIAEPQFNFDANSWMLPASETEYQRGLDRLNSYLLRLTDSKNPAYFYARADNLTRWLADVSARLGSLSQRLSASVGKPRLNTNLAGEPEATQSAQADKVLIVKTPWSQIDDVFYEARGTSWALIELLSAIEVDFNNVLRKKNALVSLQQIIRELQGTQDTIWSPMILNGSGFGILANHSLVMANYISRANAGVIDLRRLLEKG